VHAGRVEHELQQRRAVHLAHLGAPAGARRRACARARARSNGSWSSERHWRAWFAEACA
jgi:hypothetical protein